MRLLAHPLLTIAVLAATPAWGAETERLYLTGKGKDDPVRWEFFCTAGMNANKWSTIGVPSNWELQGFGIYTYGRDTHREGWPKVQGRYRRSFSVPAAWRDKHIHLVFDGVMTDTQAFINGEPAGPVHQGGFYRFKYDVTKLIKPGQDNRIEVTVDDESANASINIAERRGDYWNFGGIFRPVYFEASPPVHVERVAIDARADGAFAMDVFVHPGDAPVRVSGRLLDMAGRQVGTLMEGMLGSGQAGPARLTTRLANPRTWSAETPNLYQVEVTISPGDGVPVHTYKQRFGFRTIEVRRGDTPAPGLFVNGRRVLLKGANRHSFWPDSGRTLSPEISRDDILLMQSMNMNAVRMSHYPPDEHFLDLCDEMGLYVLDELAGWQRKYDTPTGRRLVEEMLIRDVNHPSILFWDNGNEGGWNTEIDDDFAKWDPQGRPVLHPWDPFRGIDTKHYANFALHTQKAGGLDLYMPTEMIHALYDGGAGAGLEDYWKVIRESKVGAGGFIWALVDESVKRTDERGRLDSKGNLAPDGIVGPYREKEGSAYTLQELWSPIVVTRKDGQFLVENRYSFLDAKDCTFLLSHWQLPRPGTDPGQLRLALREEAKTDGPIPPGDTGRLLVAPIAANYPNRFEVLTLTIKDPAGRELWTHAWPDADFTANFNALTRARASTPVRTSDGADTLTVTVGDLLVRFSKTTGQLTGITRGGKPYSLSNGPRLFQGLPQPEQRNARGPATAAASAPPPVPPTLVSLTHAMDGADLLVTATYSGDLHTLAYRIRPNGWITIDYAYSVNGPRDYFGIAFDYPETQVQSMRYLGNGPSRVWKNRLAGGTLGVWDKTFNDTSTGEPAPNQAGRFDYPEFKGYYAGVRWAQVQTSEGPITLLLDQGDAQGAPPAPPSTAPTPAAVQPPLYLQVLTPRVPEPQLALRSTVNVGRAGFAILHAIPPIGSKFEYASATGPGSQRAVGAGVYKGTVSVFIGPLPH